MVRRLGSQPNAHTLSAKPPSGLRGGHPQEAPEGCRVQAIFGQLLDAALASRVCRDQSWQLPQVRFWNPGTGGQRLLAWVLAPQARGEGSAGSAHPLAFSPIPK